MIAALAVDAALHRVRKDTFFQTGLADFLGDVLFFWERFASSFVFDEFDAEEEAEATDITGMGVRLKRGKRNAEIFCGGSHAIKQLARFEVVEGDRMSLVSEAVNEGGGAAFECRDDARGNENRAEGRVPAGDSFPHQNHVRLDAPVLGSKRSSGTAHAGHNFVRDEENSVLAADFRAARCVTLGRHGGAESGTNDWLEDEGRGFLGFVLK